MNAEHEGKKNYKYFQFPLMLLHKVHTNYHEAMEDIAVFSIVDFALKQGVSLEDAAKQAYYTYYTDDGLNEVASLMYQYIVQEQIPEDEDYRGFQGNTFEPDEMSLRDVYEVFHKDAYFMDLAIKNCQLKKVDEFFRVDTPSHDTLLNRYYKLKDKLNQYEAKFGNDPMPTIETGLFFDFKNKTPTPLLFSSYIAIRSLQGQNNYIATTRKVILMRMLGAKSHKALKEHLKTKTLKGIHDKFTRTDNALRYNFDKLFNRLLTRGLLRSKIFERKVSRKIFLSTTIDHNELSEKIIEFAQKKQHRKKENEARQKIKEAIK